MILFILSFIAGILTILAPCTLPLLPVIVGSSISGVPSKKRALVISASLGFSIILFTFLLKVSTTFISIPEAAWSIISGVIIIIFGIISLTPEIWEDLAFVGRLNRSSNRLLATGYKRESFLGDIIIGLSLGPVFSSCSPTYFVILASVLPQSLALGAIYLVAYTVGLSGTLLLIAFVGQSIVVRFSSLSDTHGWFRRSLGIIFILLGISIVSGFEKKLEVRLLNSGVFDITKVEQILLRLNDKSLNSDLGNVNATSSSPYVPQTFRGPKAPEIANPSGFINTNGEAITIGQFKGKKVVLIDIWTYSCINCQRTLPYLVNWYEKYKDQGLVIIGVHTPEFGFEKIQKNVESAVKKFGLTYPIVMDNDYSTWNVFGNQYWPRKYLISANGEIVYDHIGEGNYEETEKMIQRALSELNNKEVLAIVTPPKDVIYFEANKVKSPEVYFGSNRNEYLANGRRGISGYQNLILPNDFNSNLLYLDGTWLFSPESAMGKTSGKIIFKYNAKNVYMVASSGVGVTINVFKDGKKEKTVFIKENQLYNIIEGSDYGEHILEIDSPAELNVFTFTFG